MTITRVGQLTAENRNLAALSQVRGSTMPTISATQAKTGGFSYRFESTTDPSGLLVASTNAMRAGVWVYHNSHNGGNAQGVILGFFRSTALATGDYVCYDATTGDLQLYIANVLQDSVDAASVGFDAVATWFHVGMTIKTGGSGFVSVYLNSEQILTYSGSVAASIIYAVCGGRTSVASGGWATYAYFDDFYADDTTAEVDAAPPQYRYDYVTTSGAGANAAWTGFSGANYLNVDEAPPDDDTTYNRAIATALKDTFATANITIPADHRINAVIPMQVVKRENASVSSQIRLHAFDGAIYADGTDRLPGTTYAELFEYMLTQPDATDWNEIDTNAMQFGYESRGVF